MRVRTLSLEWPSTPVAPQHFVRRASRRLRSVLAVNLVLLLFECADDLGQGLLIEQCSYLGDTLQRLSLGVATFHQRYVDLSRVGEDAFYCHKPPHLTIYRYAQAGTMQTGKSMDRRLFKIP